MLLILNIFTALSIINKSFLSRYDTIEDINVDSKAEYSA